MQKTYGYRKPAMLVALVFVAGLVLVACSSSSSTDDALSQPDRLIATFDVHVNPGADQAIDISEPDMAVPISVAEGIRVWTCKPGTQCPDPHVVADDPNAGGTWDGTDTTSGDIYLKWMDTTSRLENADIEIFTADAEGMDATLNNDDICGGATIGGCATNPGYFYVADTAAQGPETEPNPAPNNPRIKRVIAPMTTVKVPWSIVESSGNSYWFRAMLMADKYAATTAQDDPRYDPNTATVTTQAYAFDLTASKNPGILTDQPITTASPGQWFYAVTWVDYPGANRPGTGYCADGGNNDGTCTAGDGASGYDYYFVEDQDNFNHPSYQNLQVYPSYCSWYNTGFSFMGGGYYELQWDPAILTVFDNLSGTNNFKTANGTTLYSAYDADLSDGVVVSGSGVDVNGAKATLATVASYSCSPGSSPVVDPPMPDRVDSYPDPTIPGNWVQGDYAAGRVSVQVKPGTPVGLGSRLGMSNNGNMSVFVGFGRRGTSGGGCLNYQCAVTETSPNYPLWVDAGGPGSNRLGAYNERMGYIEVQ